MLRDTDNGYGLVAVAFHWLVAILVIGLFALGLWMVELSYYDPWYNRAPDIHRGVGIILVMIMVARVLWRFFNPKPAPLNSHSRFEQISAKAAHHSMYLLIFLVMVSGYLISTADGRSIDVFGWFSVPALLSGWDNQADIAGAVHEYSAWALVILAGVHALAGLKHHVIDRDNTLLRMLGRRGQVD